MQNRLTTQLLILLITITFTCVASPALSLPQNDPIGTVVAVRGVVNAISADGQSRRLSIKAPVFGADSLETGKRGRIQLLFSDNTIMSLGQNTQMKIAEYRWSETAAKDAAMKTQVKEGTFRVLGGAITKAAPENFTTETPSATIGIRGSSYAGKVTKENLTVVLLGGKGVNIFNSAGLVPLTKVGFGTVVTPGMAPMKPFKFTPRDMKKLSGGLISNGEEKKSEELGPKDEGQQDDEGEPEEQAANEDDAGNTDQAADNGTTDEESQNGDEQTAATDPTQDSAPADTADNEDGGATPAGEPSLVNEISTEDAPSVTDLPPVFAPIAVANPQTYDVVLDIPTEEIPPTETLDLEFVPTIPTNGIEGFSGWIKGSGLEHDGTIETIDELFLSEVNWYSRKFMGVVDKIDDPLDPNDNNGGPVIFFGSINDDGTIANTRVIGSDMIWDDYLQMGIPSRVIGTGAGQFINLDNSLTFGFDSSGTSIDLATQSLQETWNISGSGTSLGIDTVDATAPTGSVIWEGFVTGFAEDIADPQTDRRLLTNSDISEFTMYVNRDTGSVSGNFTASDGVPTVNVNIGGTNGSAYILDDNIVAILDGTVTNVGTNNLLPNSSFMHSGDPDKPKPASYIQWGYWASAYVDPSTSAVYDVHYPGSYWIAGVPTSMSGTFPVSVAYTYTGKAYGVEMIGS
ncbi:MAG: FecR domain-containing protein, partial [Desulfobulbaceae bacterium]|nr:FecR domain-containing protein [Desulfobulbaceae bacterium]